METTVYHKNLTGTDLHEPKAHASNHEAGSDALSLDNIPFSYSGMVAIDLQAAIEEAFNNTTAVSLDAVTESIIPYIDNAYDIGENTTPLRWKDLFLSGDIEMSGGTFNVGTAELVIQGLIGETGIAVKGTAGQGAYIDCYDEDKAEYCGWGCYDGDGWLYVGGTNPGVLKINDDPNIAGGTGEGVWIGSGAREGTELGLKWWGYPTGAAAKKSGSLTVEDTTADVHINSDTNIILVPTGGDVKIEGNVFEDERELLRYNFLFGGSS